jgi:hypothetical protein
VFLVSACATLCFGGAASADILKSTYFKGDSVGTSRAAVQVTNAGSTSVKFKVPVSGLRVAITYSAHCGAEGPLGGFINIDIVVDGVVIPPTDFGSDIFCSTDSTTAIDTFIRASIIGTKTLAPGKHTVEVFAEPMGGATSFQLGASTLLVQN